MGAVSETLRLLVTLDADQAIREMDKMERTASRSGGATEDKLDKVGATMTRVGAAMVAGGLVAAAGLKKAGDKAIELHDAIAGNERVFGNAITVIDEFGEASAEAVGMSESAFRQQSNVIGSMLINLGYTQQQAAETSVQLSTVASDLAAAFGTEPQQAIEAIGALLRGERDPIEQFGIGIKQVDVNARIAADGLDTSSAAALKNSSAIAGLDLLMEQASIHTGAFGESAASAGTIAQAKFEDFQAQLGEEVIPIISGVADGASKLLDGFGALDDATGGLTSTVATWGTGLLLAGGAVTTISGKLIQMRNTAVGVKAVNLVKSLGLSAGGAGVLGVALGGAALAFGHFANKAKEAKARVDAVRDSIDAAGSITDGLTEILGGAVHEGTQLGEAMADTGTSIDEVNAAVQGTDEEFNAMVDKLGGLSQGAFGAYKELKAMRGGVEESEEAMHRAAITSGDFGAKQGELTSYVRDLTGATDDAAESTDELEQSTYDASAAQDDLAQAYADAESALESYRDEVRQTTDKSLAYRDAVRDLKTKTDEYAEAEGNLNNVHSDASIAFDDLYESALDTAQAFGEAKGAGQGQREQTRLQIEKLRELAAVLPNELRPQIESYISDLLRIPSNRTTTITTLIEPPRTISGGPDNGRSIGQSRTGGLSAPASRIVTGGKRGGTTVNMHGDNFSAQTVAGMLTELSRRQELDIRVGSVVGQ